MKDMTLPEIKTLSLAILDDIHQFCTKNGIRYSLYGGTMIGAIRHKGFIPWDDDVDIAMARPDYERFLAEYVSEKGFRLFHAGNSGAQIGFARVCEMEKTEADFTLAPWNDVKTGLWVDVFPLDVAPDDMEEAKAHIARLSGLARRMMLLRQSRAAFQDSPSLFYGVKLLVKKLIYQNPFYDRKKIVRRFISECRRYEDMKTEHFCNFSYLGFGIREYQLSEDFSDFISVCFEGKEYSCCSGYDRLMRTKYGDYMQLPPEDKRVTHHPMYNKWK